MRLPEPVLPANVKQWLVQKLLSGASALDLMKLLLQDGYTFEAIKKALGSNLSPRLTYEYDAAFFQRLSRPAFLAQQDYEDYSTDDIQLYALPGFLSEQECESVIAHAKTDLKPSQISGGDKLATHRTSTTCNLSFIARPELKQIEEKIIQSMGLGIGEQEVMQAQHYAPGQEFKAHTDYFEPGADEYKRDARCRGQRTWTFMLYLNEDCTGGETEFIDINRRFKPTRGMALVWNNLYPNGVPNPNTLHRSIPIESGEKVIITKWFRHFN